MGRLHGLLDSDGGPDLRFAIRETLNRTLGMPTQPVEMSGDVGLAELFEQVWQRARGESGESGG